MDIRYPMAPADPTSLIEGEDVGVAIFEMTPEVAALWLRDFNVHNRPLQARHSNSLATEIREGRWRLTHQGIAIDRELRLLDGQHRLQGIVDSGRAVPIQVTWNLSPDIFPVIDTGKRRTAADALALSDVATAKHTTLMASTARFLVGRYTRSFRQLTNNESLALSNEQIVEAVRELGEERVAKSVTLASKLLRTLNGTSVASFIYVVDRAGAPAEVVLNEFLMPISKGLGLNSEADPRYAARSYLERQLRRSVTHQRRAEMFTVLCQAWNAWAQQAERRLFRTPSDFVDVIPLPADHPAAVEVRR